MHKVFFALISFLFVLASCKHFEVLPAGDVKNAADKNGFFYFLPRTGVVVDITVEKTDKVKGPFASYAPKYLGISNVVSENTTTFEISDIKISAVEEPDPEKIFFVSFPEKKKGLQMKFDLTPSGILRGLNGPGDSLLNFSEKSNLSNHEEEDAATYDPSKYFATKNIIEKTDTTYEKIILDTMTITKQILTKNLVEKSMEAKAKDVSDYLAMIAENKMNLISGYQEIGYTRESLDLMIRELDQLRDDYMALFIGHENKQKLHYRFTFLPESTPKNTRIFLFNFSREKGVNTNPESKTTTAKSYFLELMPSLTVSRVDNLLQKQKSEMKHKGIYYNLPEKTKIMVVEDSEGMVAFETTVYISQFGKVAFLPLNIRKMELYPNGALKKAE